MKQIGDQLWIVCLFQQCWDQYDYFYRPSVLLALSIITRMVSLVFRTLLIFFSVSIKHTHTHKKKRALKSLLSRNRKKKTSVDSLYFIDAFFLQDWRYLREEIALPRSISAPLTGLRVGLPRAFIGERTFHSHSVPSTSHLQFLRIRQSVVTKIVDVLEIVICGSDGVRHMRAACSRRICSRRRRWAVVRTATIPYPILSQPNPTLAMLSWSMIRTCSQV